VATTPKFQRLSIFVPKEYMSAPGVIEPKGVHGKHTAATVPVIFENNSAGYMQMPHTYLGGPREFAQQYLEAGFVYVTCGNRGHESKGADGKYVGRSPINLIDLKTGIRFLRHNRQEIPGDLDTIISVGWSAGGAMSTLLGVTGDNENYKELLEANGAFMDESDAVFASQIYCPIIDLEHADLAYEWMFRADKENEASPAGPASVMDDFREALSGKLSDAYITYFNSLQLKRPDTGELLVLGPDGRSGSGYHYLMDKISESATIYLNKLKEGTAPQDYSVEDYLAGNYSYEATAPMGGPEDGKEKSNDMQGFAGPGVALNGAPEKMERKEPPTLGEMVSRPPKGAPVPPSFKPPMVTLQGKDKHAWLHWDGNKAIITDLDAYVLNNRRRMKPCTSFDVLDCQSGENKVFGTAEENARHFNPQIGELIGKLKAQFPEEYDRYYTAYAAVEGYEDQKRQKYLINPLNFIGTGETSNQAKHFRIRVGSCDADTSLSVSMTLACKLAETGADTSYQLVWDLPHCEADYPGEIIDWIDEITA
jgi:hypothetical protein